MRDDVKFNGWKKSQIQLQYLRMLTQLNLGTGFPGSYSAAKRGTFGIWTRSHSGWIRTLVLRWMSLCYSHVKDLAKRTIRYAGDDSLNYFTVEVTGLEAPGFYAVFFEVERDKRRKRRLLLYIQSAYRLERLTHRLSKAGKVRFATLLRKTYQGR